MPTAGHLAAKVGRHTRNAELQEAEDEEHTRNSHAYILESEKKNPRASVLGQEFDKTLQWALCVALAKSPSLNLMGTIVSQVFVRLKRGWKMIILSSTAVAFMGGESLVKEML